MPKSLQSSNKSKSEFAHKQKAAPLDWAAEVDLSFLESHTLMKRATATSRIRITIRFRP